MGATEVEIKKVALKPMSLVFAAMTFAFVASFVVTSLRDYGGFGYAGHPTSLTDAIIESMGAALILPLVHLAIASAWKAKRNPRSRRNIFFGWGVAVGLIQVFNYAQLPMAGQAQVTRSSSNVVTVADPNQNMEGSYCDRLASIGKSMVNGRDKGTQRSTLEKAITDAAAIGDNERVMYRQMAQLVYDQPSLTEAAMYERTHDACEVASTRAINGDRN